MKCSRTAEARNILNLCDFLVDKTLLVYGADGGNGKVDAYFDSEPHSYPGSITEICHGKKNGETTTITNHASVDTDKCSSSACFSRSCVSST